MADIVGAHGSIRMEKARTKTIRTFDGIFAGVAAGIALAALLVSRSCSTEPVNPVTPQYSRTSPPLQYGWRDEFPTLHAIFGT
jgi:hypothetical protein